MGSVKDLVVLEKPDKNKTGRAQFIFSDRYSVFDWGEMPDKFDDKGSATCITTAYFFEKLEEMGTKTHYLGVVEEGKVKRLSELKSPQPCMEIKLLRVLKPDVKGCACDYSAYTDPYYRRACPVIEYFHEVVLENFLIPHEIIYHNSLPEGSSVFGRLAEGSLKLEDFGLKEMPYPGQVLERPLVDVATKLEASHRYLSWEEARRIAGMSEDEVEEIKRITLLINELITKEAKRTGLTTEEGKVEFGFDEDRDLIVVDALGTLDECRFTYRGMPVGNQIARIFYRKTPWYEEIEGAKEKDKVGWKKLVKNRPPSLPPDLKDSISLLYKAYCNEVTRRIWFEGVPSVKEIMEEIKEVLQS